MRAQNRVLTQLEREMMLDQEQEVAQGTEECIPGDSVDALDTAAVQARLQEASLSIL